MLSEAQLADLRARNPVPLIAERLGVKLRKAGRRLIGACPICGQGKSKTPTRFEATSDESWACAVCEAGGDVIRLVELARRKTFRGAVEWLGGPQELSPEDAERLEREARLKREKRERETEKFREQERIRCWRIWVQARREIVATPLEAYLRGRGIDALDGLALRFAPKLGFWHGEIVDERGRKSPRLIHEGPAQVAAFVDGAGVFRGVHLTWIDPARPGAKATIADPDTGEILNPKKMRGTKAGNWVLVERPRPGADLWAPGAALATGEGIETILTAREADTERLFSYVAAGDLGNLAGPAVETVPHPTLKTPHGRPQRVPGPEPDLDRPGLPIPDSVEELRLIADGDSDAFLTRLAMMRAGKRYARPGRRVMCTWPPDGADLNDVARGKA